MPAFFPPPPTLFVIAFMTGLVFFAIRFAQPRWWRHWKLAALFFAVLLSMPLWITDGYSTLFHEADEQLAAAGAGPPGLVAVPVGVGALAYAAVRHYRSGSAAPAAPAPAPTVLSVEPANAPAIISSLHAGRVVTVPTAPTIMAGLNCGTPSATGWPMLQAGLDAAVTVTDGEAARAVRDLQATGVDSGPCGAAALAGVRALARTGALADTAVLLLSTEGRAANPLPEGTA